jgi:DNA-binding IclR family transcriptional regulator
MGDGLKRAQEAARKTRAPMTREQSCEAVLGHLRAHPAIRLTCYELGRALRMNPSTVRRACADLTAAGVVCRHDESLVLPIRITFHLSELDESQVVG